jgi:mono/diheme cytochrome c family protein
MPAIWFSALFVIIACEAASSQEIGDAELGLQYAESVCAPCHAVHAHQIDSFLQQATPFQIVADASGMTPNALTAWLQTSHPSMPNIIMTDEDTRNVIEYILSLRTE